MTIPASAVPFVQAALSGRPATWPDPDREASERLTDALYAHGIIPLVHDGQRRAGAEGVPETVRHALAAEYMGNAARNAVWLAELGRVTEALERVGVNPVVLKGAALLGTAYENIALRPMVDIDMLVAGRRLDAASAALTSLGYARHRLDVEAHRHHREYHRRGPGGLDLMVELHQRLFAAPPLDRVLPTDALIARAVTTGDGGRRVLCAVDTLLHLSGHLVLQHARDERLIWVADIARVVGPLAADDRFWSDLAARAREALLARSVSDALHLARQWFDCPVPDAALSALTDPAPSKAERDAYARLRQRAPAEVAGARVLDDVQSVEGVRAKVTLARRHLFPPPGDLAAFHDLDRRWKLPIYYARRVLRGLGHIMKQRARSRTPDLRTALEPPERWMIDHDA